MPDRFEDARRLSAWSGIRHIALRAVDDQDTDTDQQHGQQTAGDVQCFEFIQQQRRENHPEDRVQEGEHYNPGNGMPLQQQRPEGVGHGGEEAEIDHDRLGGGGRRG